MPDHTPTIDPAVARHRIARELARVTRQNGPHLRAEVAALHAADARLAHGSRVLRRPATMTVR